MKKSLLSILLMLLPMLASADVYEIIDGIRYSLMSGKKQAKVEQLVYPNKYKGDIVIPETVEYEGMSYDVTIIASEAFWRCSELTSVVIPNSVTEIGFEAFAECGSLTSIIIPNSVTTLGGYVLSDCSSLTSVTIGNSIKSLLNTFTNCSALTSVTIPNSVTTIDIEAFSGCTSLTSLTIGNGVTYIGQNAFYECKELADVYCYAKKAPSIWDGNDPFAKSPIKDATLHVPSASLDDYKSSEPWSNFGNIVAINIPEYTLTYYIDGEKYKSYTIEEGETIVPEDEPTRKGYTFSGWSEIPETMPDHDVTVNGYFYANTYTLTYVVDGEEYKSYDLEYGEMITPEDEPTRKGYTFSGWSEIPETMPDHDVTVNGYFYANTYTLTYVVDGEEYKSYDMDYGTVITPEPAPTKEGYTFSGWSEIPETMPAHDITVTGSFIINKYKLTYMVDGEEYKSYDIEYGATITPEAEPTKEGYSFSGWSEIPQTMPAYNVTVTGTFTKGTYKLIYMVDGEVYKTVSYDYGVTITPEPAPTKEGYSFSGWSEIPQTMPANDVTVTGTFTINKYKLTYMVDGEVYKTFDVEFGATITPEPAPIKEGYTFSGWSWIPSKMPAEDVVVTGTFTQKAVIKDNVTYEIDGNSVSVTYTDKAKGVVKIESSVEINGQTYQVTAIAEGAFQGCTELTSVEIPSSITAIGNNAFNGCSALLVIKIGKGVKEIGNKAFANIASNKARTRGEDEGLNVYCEAEVIPSTASDAFENTAINKATLHVVDEMVDAYKYVMPWNGFGTIVGLTEDTGINAIMLDSTDAQIYDMQGNRLDNLRKGVNIIREKDGRARKVVVK